MIHRKLPNKAFSERHPKSRKMSLFLEKSPLFAAFLYRSPDVLVENDPPIIPRCTGSWGFCGTFEHFSRFELFLFPNRIHTRPSASNADRWAVSRQSL